MSIYCQTARFDGTGRALGEDELRKLAPSIFATQAHESRSERFAPIATIDVLRGLEREGFFPVGAKQSLCRMDDRKDFTKHLIRLRRMDDATQYRVNDTVCEILLKNANDGSSAYDLLAGLFRICCLNSLVAQTGTVEQVKVRHSGDVAGKVIEGTYKVLEGAHAALEAPEKWSQLMLPPPAKTAMAEAAHVIRFGDHEGNVKTPIKADQLLHARRTADQKEDLWTVFNTVQENCLKGGISAYQPYDRETRRGGRYVTARAIKGIDQDVRVNKALWIVAQAMADKLAA